MNEIKECSASFALTLLLLPTTPHRTAVIMIMDLAASRKIILILGERAASANIVVANKSHQDQSSALSDPTFSKFLRSRGCDASPYCAPLVAPLVDFSKSPLFL